MAALEPRSLASAQDLADALGISRLTAAELIAAEAAGPAYRHGRVLLTGQESIADLAERRPAETSLPAINVKVRAAFWSETEQRYIGWHARLPEEDLDVAIGRWWAVRAAEEIAEAQWALVATIGGWVVAVRRITGVETDRGQRAFQLAPATKAQRGAYEQRRLPPQAGSLVQRLGDP